MDIQPRTVINVIIDDEIGEDGRRINPARDARERGDDLYMNSTARSEHDARTDRYFARLRGKG